MRVLKILRPANWELTLPKQSGEFATIAPAAGVTGKGIGYGVLVNGVPAQPGARVNIDDITARIVNQMEQSSGLQPDGNPQAITAGGMEGRSVMMHSASPFPSANGEPQIERDWLVTLPQRDGSVILMIFVAPQAEYGQFQGTYEEMLKSVQFP